MGPKAETGGVGLAGYPLDFQHPAFVGGLANVLLREIYGFDFQLQAQVFAGYAVQFFHLVMFGRAAVEADGAGFHHRSDYGRLFVVMHDFKAASVGGVDVHCRSRGVVVELGFFREGR